MTSREDREDFNALLAHVPLPDGAKSELLAMMGSENRHYHGVGHLALLWRRH
jgi:predicted metal-dependent HD superfamily phosphohydrolase